MAGCFEGCVGSQRLSISQKVSKVVFCQTIACCKQTLHNDVGRPNVCQQLGRSLVHAEQCDRELYWPEGQWCCGVWGWGNCARWQHDLNGQCDWALRLFNLWWRFVVLQMDFSIAWKVTKPSNSYDWWNIAHWSKASDSRSTLVTYLKRMFCHIYVHKTKPECILKDLISCSESPVHAHISPVYRVTQTVALGADRETLTLLGTKTTTVKEL